MKTIQVNDTMLVAATEYIKYMQTPVEPGIGEEEQAEYAESEPSFFTLLARFAYELAQAIEESDGKTEASV